MQVVRQPKPGVLLEEGSDDVLSANNTEHFLSVEKCVKSK